MKVAEYPLPADKKEKLKASLFLNMAYILASTKLNT